MINGVRLLRSADRLPVPTGDDSSRQGRAMRVGFGVTLAAVGVIIGVVCALLIVNGAYAYLAPAIVLVVGLHFIPLGFIFHRTIDFYIAGWVVVWALLGFWLINSQTMAAPLVASIVGVAATCSTTAYGVYMLRVKRAILATLAGSDHTTG